MIFVIGYGNYSRKDDGVGIWVGAKVRRKFRKSEKIRVLLLHQLVPEVVDELKEAKFVAFIDAGACFEEKWSLRRIEPRRVKLFAASKFLPEELLLLLKELYGRRPEAWVLSVRGSDFSFGAGLSQETRVIAEEAEKLLETLLEAKLKDA